GMAWEWARLCRGGAIGNTGAVLIAAALVAVIAAALVGTALALAAAAAGAAVVFWVAWRESEAEPRWFALGSLWIALPCVLLLWLAGSEAGGPLILLWIFAVVWATDIGAYISGRRICGPLLAQ